MKSDFIPPLALLKGLKLKNLLGNGNEVVQSESLWKDQACLIYLVRRPGCILCRNKARELQSIQSKLTEKRIKMVAILHENLGSDEFISGFWPDDPIYLDSDKSIFAAISSNRSVRKQSILSGIFSLDTWKRISRAKDAGLKGNLEGEGSILGGIFLTGPGEEGVKWVRLEKSFGDNATNEEILANI